MFARGGQHCRTTAQTLSTFPMPVCPRVGCCFCHVPTVSWAWVRTVLAGTLPTWSPPSAGSRDPFPTPACLRSSPGQPRRLRLGGLLWRSDVCWGCSRMESQHRWWRRAQGSPLGAGAGKRRIAASPSPRFPASLRIPPGEVGSSPCAVTAQGVWFAPRQDKSRQQWPREAGAAVTWARKWRNHSRPAGSWREDAGGGAPSPRGHRFSPSIPSALRSWSHPVTRQGHWGLWSWFIPGVSGHGSTPRRSCGVQRWL